jgi:hypothetical protein
MNKKPKRRWLRFSLWMLFVLVLLFSVPLSWFGVNLHQARQQRQAVEAIDEGGGQVGGEHYERDHVWRIWAWRRGGPVALPVWIQVLLGEDFSQDLDMLRIEVR